jgi:hypothetical protein
MRHGQLSLNGPAQPAEPDVALWQWADTQASDRYYAEGKTLRPVDSWTQKATAEEYD